MTRVGIRDHPPTSDDERCVAPCMFLLVLLLLVQLSHVHAMRLVLQRVKAASVTVEQNVVSSIGPGILALVGLHVDDTAQDAAYCAKKLLGAKLWPNENDKPWRQSVRQLQREVLLVSQFTLYGSVSNKKHVPDFKASMKSEAALDAYTSFKELVASEYGEPDKIKDGIFGAMMDVSLVNDGPVTLVVDSRQIDESVDRQ